MAAEIWQWVTPSGESFRLDSNIDGAQIVGSVTGRGMPPIRRTTETVPLQPGQRLRSVLHDANEVAIGIYFNADTAADQRANIRAWLARLDPTRGDGTLVVTDPAGTQRQLTCSYQDGLELEEDQAMRLDQLAVVSFDTEEPYWADTVDSQEIWTAGSPSTIFPIFPLTLGASQVFGSSTVTNLGDVETFPTWVIAGPGNALTLTNSTTGRILSWNGTLGLGEFIVVDCRPGSQSGTPKSVFKNDGSSQFGLLTAWDFWPFEVGVNAIDIELDGATSDSQVTAVWRNRYLGA